MRVRVWNDNIYPFSQEFKGDKLTVEAKQCIEMEYDEAIEFLRQFSPPVFDVDGRHDPRGFKKLRIEKHLKEEDEPQKPVVLYSPVTGRPYQSQAELDQELKNYDHLRVKDDEAEKEIERRGRGRPRKEA